MADNRLTVFLHSVRDDIDHTGEQLEAWRAVLRQLYKQYSMFGLPEEVDTHRVQSLSHLLPCSSFYYACDTGVPTDELAAAFMMVFGETPFSEGYTPSYLRR